jgi:hypothetical protein
VSVLSEEERVRRLTELREQMFEIEQEGELCRLRFLTELRALRARGLSLERIAEHCRAAHDKNATSMRAELGVRGEALMRKQLEDTLVLLAHGPN